MLKQAGGGSPRSYATVETLARTTPTTHSDSIGRSGTDPWETLRTTPDSQRRRDHPGPPDTTDWQCGPGHVTKCGGRSARGRLLTPC